MAKILIVDDEPRIRVPSFLFARQEKYWSIPRSAAVSVRLPTIDIRLSLRR